MRIRLLVAFLLLPLITLLVVYSLPAPEAQEAQNIDPVLVGAGDLGGCGRRHATASTAALLDEIPGTVVTLGDNVYPDGMAEEFAEGYAPNWGRQLDRTMPAAGNHDYHTPGAAGYFGYFGTSAGDPAKGFYSYNVGSWHVVVLNSNCEEAGGCDAASPQGRWLETDLAAHPATCTLAYWHHPLFSSGAHGPFPAVQDFWLILYRHQADVVLNGHDHNYERFRRLNPDGTWDPRGLREFVVGTGGAPLREGGKGTPDPNSAVFNDTQHGVLKLTLHESSYDWQFVPVAGGTFQDSGSASCID